MAAPGTSFSERQHEMVANWDIFGDIVHDYLGIPYKANGRAVESLTRVRTGVATKEIGLVCTSFVDVVLSRYIHDDAERQLDSYRFGDGVNIFDKYGKTRLRTNVEPVSVASAGLSAGDVYGIVFHMRNAWVKSSAPLAKQHRNAGSRIHVGFLAFHNGNLFLIHASGRKGVHVVAWQRFLTQFGKRLQKFGGGDIKGPKFLSIYQMGAA